MPTGVQIVRCLTSPGCKHPGSSALVLTVRMPPGAPSARCQFDRRSGRRKEVDCRGQDVLTYRPIDRGKCVPEAIRRDRPPDDPPKLLGHVRASPDQERMISRTRPVRVRGVPMPNADPIGPAQIPPVRNHPDSLDSLALVRNGPRVARVPSVQGRLGACQG